LDVFFGFLSSPLHAYQTERQTGKNKLGAHTLDAIQGKYTHRHAAYSAKEYLK
jgi:hypothetical protein